MDRNVIRKPDNEHHQHYKCKSERAKWIFTGGFFLYLPKGSSASSNWKGRSPSSNWGTPVGKRANGGSGMARRPSTDTQIAGGDEAPWQMLAPSAIPYAEGWHIPEEMTRADIEGVKYAFGMPHRGPLRPVSRLLKSTRRKDFCSTSSIFRSPIIDVMFYGVSFENRVRLCREVAHSIRAA